MEEINLGAINVNAFDENHSLEDLYIMQFTEWVIFPARVDHRFAMSCKWSLIRLASIGLDSRGKTIKIFIEFIGHLLIQ